MKIWIVLFLKNKKKFPFRFFIFDSLKSKQQVVNNIYLRHLLQNMICNLLNSGKLRNIERAFYHFK